MLNFPQFQDETEPARQKMSLLEYAEFSLFCLENNPHITPQNCMQRQSGEESMTRAFRIIPL